MNALFFKLLEMSITASGLMLVVFAIRLLFRQAPKWFFCLLWGVVALRLVIPFSIESPYSLQPREQGLTSPIANCLHGERGLTSPITNCLQRTAREFRPPQNTENVSYAGRQFEISANATNPIDTKNAQDPKEKSETTFPQNILANVVSNIGRIWCSGMLILLSSALVSYIKLLRNVREAVCDRENIYLCDAVRMPFLFGIFRPRIYLPSSLEEVEMTHIIAHEEAHLQRKDHIWKPLGYLLLCIYWFHPLCILAYKMFCKDIELACDEKVIRHMSFRERKAYANVLVTCSMPRRKMFVCPLAFGEVGVKERVKSILSYKKPHIWMTAILAIFMRNRSLWIFYETCREEKSGHGIDRNCGNSGNYGIS